MITRVTLTQPPSINRLVFTIIVAGASIIRMLLLY